MSDRLEHALAARIGSVRDHIEQALDMLATLEAAIPLHGGVRAALQAALLLQDPAAATERDVAWLFDNSPWFNQLVQSLAHQITGLAAEAQGQAAGRTVGYETAIKRLLDVAAASDPASSRTLKDTASILAYMGHDFQVDRKRVGLI